MPYTPNHNIRKGTSTDTWSHTEDYENFRDIVDAALKYIAAHDSNAGNYVSAAAEGGILDGAIIVPDTGNTDARLIFQDFDGTDLSPQYELGYRDSDGALWISPNGQLGVKGLKYDGTLDLLQLPAVLHKPDTASPAKGGYLNFFSLELTWRDPGGGFRWQARMVVNGDALGEYSFQKHCPSIDPNAVNTVFNDVPNMDASFNHPASNSPVSFMTAGGTDGIVVFRTPKTSDPWSTWGHAALSYTDIGADYNARLLIAWTGGYGGYPGIQIVNSAGAAYDFSSTTGTAVKRFFVQGMFIFLERWT